MGRQTTVGQFSVLSLVIFGNLRNKANIRLIYYVAIRSLSSAFHFYKMLDLE